MRDHVEITPTVISNPSACRAESNECELKTLAYMGKCGPERICYTIKLYASKLVCTNYESDFFWATE